MFSYTGGACTKTGGCAGARHRLVILAIVSCGLASQAMQLTAATQPPPEVIVREARGVYTVAARFEVPQPTSRALAVLTDYEQIPRFMPGVTTSIVRERSAGRVIVEQEAVSRILMFSKRVHLLLEVYEERDTVWFRDSAGRSFRCYEGAWRLSQRDGQTVITYELSAKPAFEVPEFLLQRLLTRDARQMIERLRAEISARG